MFLTTARNALAYPYMICYFLMHVLFTSIISGAHATETASLSDWFQHEYAQIRLLTLPNQKESLDIRGGLHVQLQDGWKIYWRSPGEAGTPPVLDWQGSQNLKSTQFYWPVPERFTLFDITTYGYGTEVIFPITWTKQQANSPLSLSASLSMLACKEICVPLSFALSFNPETSSRHASSEEMRVYSYFSGRIPISTPHAQSRIYLDSFHWSQTSHQKEKTTHYPVTLQLSAAYNLSVADILIEGLSEWTHTVPSIQIESNDLTKARISFDFIPLYHDSKRPISSPLTVTVLNRDNHSVHAVETSYLLSETGTSLISLDGETLPAPPFTNIDTSRAWATSALFSILGIAFLGGLILNLMPCVLPVLSLKVLHLMSHANAHKHQIRMSFLMTSAGILFSFWCLAALLIILKALGAGIGWGIQFQYPPFLIFLIIVLTLFALNLFGAFNVLLPTSIMDRIVRILPAETETHSHRTSFLNGAFATLLATPCSAPFLGTAVSFALAHGSLEIITIFTFLGLGLAFPYLLIAALPQTAHLLPKPGKWMAAIKHVMAILLSATALWLTAILFFPGFLSEISETDSEHPVNLTWHAFEPEKISNLTQSGKIVLIDVTADWCLTCKVNEKLVFSDPDVSSRLKQEDIWLMRADWTRADPAITAFLTKHGRYGIPFNILYASHNKSVILPELLQKAELLTQLRHLTDQ